LTDGIMKAYTYLFVLLLRVAAVWGDCYFNCGVPTKIWQGVYSCPVGCSSSACGGGGVDKATGGYTIALATVDCGKQLTSIALKADDAKIVLRKTPAEIAPYPPMQWHSWGLFTHEGLITEANMLEMAEALISSGMAAAGYSTVNVVCNGWVGRDPTTGVLQENHTSWPNGMASFARKLHAMEPPLKLGCYTSPRSWNGMCGE
jgi:hypothetical protein